MPDENIQNEVIEKFSFSDSILAYIVDPQKEDLRFFYKKKNGELIGNAGQLRDYLSANGAELIFAVNGGMYTRSQAPQGLYIEENQLIAPLDTQSSGYGNFYLQPNGIFYLTNTGIPYIRTTSAFRQDKAIRFATQSGPMLLIDGYFHPKIRKGSSNLHIRNGVGVLPDGRVVFAMSKKRINFYDLALFFKNLGCENALYLDGFVSRTYLPEQDWEEVDGDFGILIGVVKKRK